MNRRRFLGLIGAGVATAVAAPALKLLPAETLNVATIRQMKEQLVGRNIEPFSEYADYANFSNMAIAAAIDDSVMKAAEELGYRAGLSVNALYQCYDANIPIRHAPRLAA